eukprot:g23167.t1
MRRTLIPVSFSRGRRCILEAFQAVTDVTGNTTNSSSNLEDGPGSCKVPQPSTVLAPASSRLALRVLGRPNECARCDRLALYGVEKRLGRSETYGREVSKASASIRQNVWDQTCRCCTAGRSVRVWWGLCRH